MAPVADSPRADVELDFSFRLANGAGRLTLEDTVLFRWLQVERLELEVPNLEPPVDLAAGPQLFQSTRTQIASAALRVGQRQLDELLSQLAPRLVEVGADRVAVQPSGDHLTVTARFRDGANVAELVATFRVSPLSGQLAVILDHSMLFGFVPTPAPVLAHRLLLAITGAAKERPYPGGPVVRGLGYVEIDTLGAVLWHAFPRRGWRLPDPRNVALIGARLGSGGMMARFARDAESAEPQAAVKTLLESLSRHRQAEEALLRGDNITAIRDYRTALAGTGPDQDFVCARLLSIAAADPSQFAFAVALARDALGRWPNFPPAHAAVASVRLAQNDPIAAAERYRILASTATQIDDELALRAALAGARLFQQSNADQATALYERVAELRPGQPEATDALIRRYREAGRVHDLVRLLRARVAKSNNSATQLADQLLLADVYLETLSDPASARDAARRATELDPAAGSAEFALAKAFRALNDHDRAVVALEAAAEKFASAGEVRKQVEALIEAAAMTVDAGEPDKALRLYERSLVCDPSSTKALVGAASTRAAIGDHGAAAKLWQRLIETSTDVPARIAEYKFELAKAMVAMGDADKAVDVLEWSADRGAPTLVAKARGLLADILLDADRGADAYDELGRAIEALDKAVVRTADTDSAPSPSRRLAASLLIRRAALAEKQSRFAEAIADNERAVELSALAPKLQRQAARALLALAQASGNRIAERRWIDVLLALESEPDAQTGLLLSRVRLAIDAGDVDRDSMLADLESTLHTISDPTLRTEALELKASLLEGADDPSASAHVLTQRIELANTPFERAVASTQAARAWLEAERPDEALRLSQQAMAQLREAGGADYAETWLTLSDAAWRKRAWSLVIQASEHLSRGDFNVPSERIAAILHRAGIALDETGDLEASAAAFERVVATDSVGSELKANTWRLLAGAYERLDQPDAAARALESFAADDDADVPPATRADAWYRAGELHRKLPGGTGDAKRCLEAALRIASDHLPALDSLERIEREAQDYERVAVILGRKIAATAQHPNRQKSLLARLADLQHLRLGRTDVARETFARALEIDDCFRPALRFVAQDARERGDVDKLTNALSKLALELESDLDLADDASSLSEERIAAAIQLADLAVEDSRSQVAELALEALEANLVPDDYDDRILEGMEAVLRAKGDWRGVADVLGQRAASASGDKALAWDLERIDILSGAVNDKGAALAAARAALARNPEDPTLGQFSATLAIESNRVTDAGDPGTESFRPEDLRARADQAYLDGDYELTAKLLEDLAGYHPLGSDEPGTRHFGNRAARGELFLQLADIYYDHLDDLPRAREAMRRAAEAFGSGSRRDATLRLLASEALSAGSPDIAGEALELIDAHRLTGNDRLQLARAHASQGHDHRAIVVLEEARHRGSLADEGAKMLSHLYRERSRKTELADALEKGAQESPADIANTRLREALNIFENALASAEGAERVRRRIDELGQVPGLEQRPQAEDLEHAANAAMRDGDSAVAADLLSRAVHERTRILGARGAAPDPHLLATLDRLRRVTYTLAPSPDLGGTGHFEALVRALLSAATISDDNAVSLLREAGAIKRNQLGDPRGAAEALSRAFARAPEQELVFSELAECLREAGDYTQLMATYELRIQHAPASQRSALLTELARVVRSATGDSARARKLADEAAASAAEEPEDAPQGELRMEAEAELTQGAALEAQGDRAAAIAHYYAAFAKSPDDHRPLEALDRLYGELGDTESQANVLGQLIEQSDDRSVRAQLWYRRARIYRDELRREHEAYRCLKEAYANNPDDSKVANALRTFAMARSEWPLAAELLYSEIASATDHRERAALQLELALIYDEKLMDPGQAIRNYQEALDLDPSIPAAPAPLARLYEHAGDYERAARVFEIAARVARSDGERRESLRRAARAALRAELPDEAERLRQLVGDDEDEGKREGEGEPTAEASPKPEPAAAMVEDPVLDEALEAGDPERLLAVTRDVLEKNPTDSRLAGALALLAKSDERSKVLAAAEMLESHAQALSEPERRADVLFQLGELRRDLVGDTNAAVVAFGQAVEVLPTHPQALDALAQIAYLRSDWEQARHVFNKIDPETSSIPAELIAFRRGEIAEMLGLDHEAMEAFSTAAELAPANSNALRAVIRSAVRAGDVARAIDAARDRLQLIPIDDITALTGARLQLGQLCDLGNDVVTAIYYFELVLAEDPNNRTALESLVTLYSAHGDNQGAIRTLRSLIAIASDLRERAERHYMLGEIYRANVGDHEAAAGEYLKGVDLDPSHAPTLRRLLDYYWTLDEGDALLEIALDLHERDALIVIETPSPTLARVMLSAAIERSPLAVRIADSLPGDVNQATAAAMVESLELGRTATAEDLAEAGRWLADQVSAINRDDLARHVTRDDELGTRLRDCLS